MASTYKNLSLYEPSVVPSGENKYFGIVVSDYNSDITYSLLSACIQTLQDHQVVEENITVWHVPGAFELPLAAQKMVEDTPELNAVICIGCVITGETKHDDYINQAVAQAIMQLGITYSLPIIFGILTPRTYEQALARAGGEHGNKGIEAAISALRMAELMGGNSTLEW